jgi:hypothetical protein
MHISQALTEALKTSERSRSNLAIEPTLCI